MKEYRVEVYSHRIEWYNIEGKLHREDGPAIEWADGDREWFLNGKRHREDGPAVEYADGDREWFLNGERHREDGPAIEHADGHKYWYLNDVRLTEEKFNQRTKTCEGKEVEIDGKTYVLKLK